MPPKSTFKWDDALERKFLLAIIQKEKISVSAKYCDEIVELMGIDTTGNACRQKFDKMKKEIVGSGGGGSAEPGTPVTKRIKAKAEGEGSTAKKSTGKRKKSAKEVNGSAEEDGEEVTPVKKVKAEREETPDEL